MTTLIQSRPTTPNDAEVGAGILASIAPLAALVDVVAAIKARKAAILATKLHDARIKRTNHGMANTWFEIELDIPAAAFPMSRDALAEFVELHAEDLAMNEIRDDGFRTKSAHADGDEFVIAALGTGFITLRVEVEVEGD